jgi:ComF family protein
MLRRQRSRFLYGRDNGVTTGPMIFDFFLPAACAGCAVPGRALCNRCAATLTNAPVIVRDESDGMPAIAALGAYDGILRSAILALKFRGARSIGVRLGRWLAPNIVWPFEAIVPVPLHPARLNERGYNQAAEIARGIAGASRIPLQERALVRSRHTAPQSALDMERRKANVEGSFEPGSAIDRVAGLRILIVDDVVTTGATVRACAAVLLAARARTVYLASAAIRLFSPSTRT